MARTRPPRSETRRKIVDAAFVVFGERGIAATSLEQVAAHAGLTKGAVYSNFRSKDELVLTLMEEHVGLHITASLDALGSDASPEQVVYDVGAALVKQMRADVGWHRLLAEYSALSHRSPDSREALRLRRREARQAVERALVRVCDAVGMKLPMDPFDFATVVIALSHGLALETDIDPDGVPEDLMARALQLMASDLYTGITGISGQPQADSTPNDDTTEVQA